MACGSCGNAKNKTYVYKWVSADGSQRATYDTETKARAAKIKNGGSYTKVAQ